MQGNADSTLSGRDRRRLALARERGYLDARCRSHEALVNAFGLWCWKLKVPMVWIERRTAHSRYARVRLEMYTSVNMLTPRGVGALEAVTQRLEARALAEISAYSACLERVSSGVAVDLAAAVFRGATRRDNAEPNRAKLLNMDVRKPVKLIPLPRAAAASA